MIIKIIMFKILHMIIAMVFIMRLEAKLPLTFPPTAPTRTQWIIGIGIPIKNLPYEDLTIGYVLKAEYFLPETVEQLKYPSTLLVAGRNSNRNFMRFQRFLFRNYDNLTTAQQILRKNNGQLNTYRWSIYKILEIISSRMHLNGHSCLLKSICELSTLPFHYENGLLGELLYILLRPSASVDKLLSFDEMEYIQAEQYGNQGGDCDFMFKQCPKSLLEYFSYIHHHIDKDTFNSYF